MAYSLRRDAALVLFGVALAGCGQDSSSEAGVTVGQSAQEIIGGVLSTSADDSAVAVPIFKGGTMIAACSGVLVAPNLVITARHCVSTISDGDVSCDANGDAVSGGEVTGQYLPSQLGVIIGPTYHAPDAMAVKIFVPDANNLCNHDIALIQLDHDLVGATIAPLRLDAPPVAAQDILAVGWGLASDSTVFERRRRAGIPIVAVGPAADADTGMAIGSAEFEIGEGICEGDSGGPAYADSGAVVGVVSRGGNGYPAKSTDPQYISCLDETGYEARNLYTRVDAFKPLIESAFAAVGHLPWLEGGPNPQLAGATAAACTVDSDCMSLSCESKICAATCAGANDKSCAGGTTCQATEANGLESYACLPALEVIGEAATSAPAANGCAMGPVDAGSARGIGTLATLLALYYTRRRRRNAKEFWRKTRLALR